MAIQKLTAKFIENIQSNGKRQEFCDPYLKGFGLRVSKMNTKTFFVRVRYRGKTERHTIGTYPSYSLAEAREKAADVIAQAEKGDLHYTENKQVTVVEVFECFLEQYAKKRQKDWRSTQSRLKKFLYEYGNTKLIDLNRRDIHTHLKKLAVKTPIQANRAHSALSRFLNWCVENFYIDYSPCNGVKKPAQEKKRTRVLSDLELLKVWRASGSYGYPFGFVIKILILTAQRRNEVAGMRWSELDLKNKVWTIPEERVKNKKVHTVPLCNEVINLLEQVPRFLHSDYVFTTTGKTPVSGLGKYKYRLNDVLGVNDWVPHDFRRTAASGMARLEISPYVVEKVLNHVSETFSGVLGVYNQYGYDREKRKALDKWAEHVIGLNDETKQENIFR